MNSQERQQFRERCIKLRSKGKKWPAIKKIVEKEFDIRARDGKRYSTVPGFLSWASSELGYSRADLSPKKPSLAGGGDPLLEGMAILMRDMGAIKRRLDSAISLQAKFDALSKENQDIVRAILG